MSRNRLVVIGAVVLAGVLGCCVGAGSVTAWNAIFGRTAAAAGAAGHEDDFQPRIFNSPEAAQRHMLLESQKPKKKR